jgi:3-deoxy-7-phosphoheptulonate synthase
VTDRRLDELKRLEFFASHEGLILEYEQAQTRQVPRRTGWYNLTTHLPWIGERTRGLDGAHVEYFRGIVNPIGVKVGPKATPEEIVELTRVLNSQNESGRLMLIHRFGVENVGACLPPFIEAIRRADRKVTWCCDPMHGNTQTTANGLKTRNFEYILGELNCAFDIHHEMGSILGGVHFELTGENVTECTGGSSGLTEADLAKSYRTDVDPRLNYEQALEMAFLVAKRVQRGGKKKVS